MRMKLFYGAKCAATFAGGTVATIGNFDGVHLGHQALLAHLRKIAKQRNMPLVVILFEPQPAEFFNKNNAPARLSSLREKIQYLKQCGVDYVYCLRFNANLAATSAADFAEQYFFSLLNVRYLLLGEDFRFGKAREGDIELIRHLACEKNCDIEIFPTFFLDNTRVSSTIVRQSLTHGKLKEAERLCGRPYSFIGRVLADKQRMENNNAQTLYLAVKRLSLAASGLFCVMLMRADGQQFKGMASINNKEIMTGNLQLLDITLFDFLEDMTGERVQVSLLQKLRDEIVFASEAAQVTQRHNDIVSAKSCFAAFNSEFNPIVE